MTATSTIRKSNYYWFVSLFLLAFVIFYLRDSVTYRNPFIYTEDGVWLGMINEHGFWYAFFNARGDYFVAVNLLILEVANLTTALLFGGSLLAYPVVLAVIVTGWYACVVSLPAMLFFRLLPPWGWMIFVGCIALLPFGHTAYEVLGRASNVGFSAFFVAFFCIAYRTFMPKMVNTRLYLIDGMILLCVLTSPLVLALYPLLLWPLWKARLSGMKATGLVKWDPSLSVLLLITCLVIAVFAYRYQAAPLIGPSLAKKTPFVVSDLITYGVGRSFLYPFASLAYPLLNNYLAVLGFFSFVFAIYFFAQDDEEIRKLLSLIMVSWIGVTIATALLRPGLVEMLSSYRATNPDRYAITQNMLILSAVLLVTLRRITRSPKLTISTMICILWIGSYVTQAFAVSLIEQALPPYETYLGSQLQLQLSAVENSPKTDFISTPIYFQGWSMRAKRDSLAQLDTCCSRQVAMPDQPRWNHDIEKSESYWTITGNDPMSYWLLDPVMPAGRLPVVKFKFLCPVPTKEWSVIGVYWLDPKGNASGDRAFTFRAKPGWQVVPLGELKNYRGDIGGLRLDMESIDTCKTYRFESIEFYKWKTGYPPLAPRLSMPWSEGEPKALLERVRSF